MTTAAQNWLKVCGDLQAEIMAQKIRLTAMKAAGDGLGPFVEHEPKCIRRSVTGASCTCGLTDALTKWKEASDGL